MGQGDIFSVPWQSVIFGSLSTFNPCSFAAAKYIRVPLMCYPLGHRRHFCHNRFSHPSSHSLSSSGVISRVSGKVAISTCPQLPFFFFYNSNYISFKFHFRSIFIFFCLFLCCTFMFASQSPLSGTGFYTALRGFAPARKGGDVTARSAGCAQTELTDAQTRIAGTLKELL